jgi:MerR family transcriptional regulator, light-induced transcriptional regulator
MVMTEGQQAPLRLVGDDDGDPVDRLASRALSVVAERKARPIRAIMPVFVDLLGEAALSRDREPFFPILHRMAQAGIKPEEIADSYVPAVARQLGDMWCSDRIGFAAVTISCARLQGLLRELGPEWRADRAADPLAPSILLIVVGEAQHTLGATVLSGQLRRIGLSVRLMCGARPDEVAILLRHLSFNAVFLSSSLGESLESLRRVVDAARAAVGAGLPIVLGGTILMDGPSAAELQALTGADHVTGDLNEALDLCGLTISTRMTRDARKG